jgi:hypothetical protein
VFLGGVRVSHHDHAHEDNAHEDGHEHVDEDERFVERVARTGTATTGIFEPPPSTTVATSRRL